MSKNKRRAAVSPIFSVLKKITCGVLLIALVGCGGTQRGGVGDSPDLRTQTTLSINVSTGDDDSLERNDDSVSLTFFSHPAPYASPQSSRFAAARFNNVTIPQGATINTATISGYGSQTGTIDITITGEDVDDSAALTATDNDVSNRTDTSASVEWDGSVTDDAYNVSPSIVSIVQEIVDRGGWSSGNDMTILYTVNSSHAGRMSSYNQDSTNPPKLDVDYTAGAARRVIIVGGGN
jgi:hypothetical protein